MEAPLVELDPSLTGLRAILTMTRGSRSIAEWGRGPEPLPIELIARTNDPTDGPRECTFYPIEVAEDAMTTTWITAKEGSFIPIEEAR